jgi:O-antigen/teichoic acid export membrane protein
VCQHGMHAVMILAGLILCPVIAGAGFFMGLLGPAVVEGAPALRVLGVLCFIKAASSTLGPVLYVVRAQNQALRFTVIAVIMRAIVVASLIPRYGYIGVAFGALFVELVFAGVPVVRIFQKTTGYRIQWGVPVKAFLIAMFSAASADLLLRSSGLAAAVLATLMYIVICFASRTVRKADVQWILKGRTA